MGNACVCVTLCMRHWTLCRSIAPILFDLPRVPCAYYFFYTKLMYCFYTIPTWLPRKLHRDNGTSILSCRQWKLLFTPLSLYLCYPVIRPSPMCSVIVQATMAVSVSMAMMASLLLVVTSPCRLLWDPGIYPARARLCYYLPIIAKNVNNHTKGTITAPRFWRFYEHEHSGNCMLLPVELLHSMELPADAQLDPMFELDNGAASVGLAYSCLLLLRFTWDLLRPIPTTPTTNTPLISVD